MERLQALQHWVAQQLGTDALDIAPASADASFRRYFRIASNQGGAKGRDYIVMDAPPAHEDCRPFLHVAQLFEQAGTHVPHVYAHDLKQGFLLLSDLGNTTYLQALTAERARALYGAATDALIKIQLASREGELPAYDEALLRRELNRLIRMVLAAVYPPRLRFIWLRVLNCAKLFFRQKTTSPKPSQPAAI